MKRQLSIVLTIILMLSFNLKVSANNAREKLENIKNTQQNLKSEIMQLDKEITETSSSINKLNEEINKLNKNIECTSKEIKYHENKLKLEDDMFKKRVRAMYTCGDTAYLDIILNSKNFSDAIDKIELVKKIIHYDKNLMDDICKNKKSIENKKEKLEINKQKSIKLKEKYNNKFKDLKNKSNEKEKIMLALEKDKNTYEVMLKEQENNSNNIVNMIKNDSKYSKSSAVVKGSLCCVTGNAFPITCNYGWREHPVLHTKKFHSGIDIGVPSGTLIYAVADGVVTYSGNMSGYGNVVMINHGDFISLYAHNSSLCVREGQNVKKGDVISYSGNTGMSTGPHLHFEIRKSTGETVDSLSYYVR
ncbi:murein DD-endopeptidase MepM [Clostridium acetireducens DSM 10703]|uniref:Murein DD-endopeptidase MepM n=1 Tax=Clostridium acetireducens DSM 10703 TaxID=1121290 RepID=A0A1E8F1N5_9CLOT|nr:M23 family metallopeptidase [Clostridium acetireducens]OFI07502.1 murein DD-endopeptidase MepM [Clostridium acetireducens DSM 10703]